MRTTATEVLTKLDAIANGGNWPRFDAPLGTFEYHAMRMVVVQECGGDEDWGVAFECVHGDFLDPGADNAYAANVSTYVIIPSDPYGIRMQRELPLTITSPSTRDLTSLRIEGTTIVGPRGPMHCTDAMLAELDLRPGMLCGGCDGGAVDSNLIVLIRAYLTCHPDAFWGDVPRAFGSPCDVVLESASFEHVVGRHEGAGDGAFDIAPSESPTFRSLAEAIVAGDATLFTPGVSNLDWRLWATIPDANARR